MMGKVNDLVAASMSLQTDTRRLLKRRCSTYGINMDQLDVLKLLQAAGPLSCTDLCHRMVTKSSTFTGILDRMVDGGLVVRRRCSRDRRVLWVDMTDRGAAVARAIDFATWDLLRYAVVSLPEDEQGVVVGVLNRVTAYLNRAIEEELGEPTP